MIIQFKYVFGKNLNINYQEGKKSWLSQKRIRKQMEIGGLLTYLQQKQEEDF